MNMRKLGILTVSYTLLASNACFAQALDQQALAALTAACQADALRLCSWNSVVDAMNGDNREIIACFRASKPLLTPACRGTIARYAPK